MAEMFKGYEDGLLPFMPAAGAINGRNAHEIEQKILDVAASPASAVKVGSFTFNGGQGNTGHTYSHNQLTGITANSMGLPNIGYQEAIRLLQKIKPQVEQYGKPLIPSFSPGQGEVAAEVLPQMALAFAEAGFEIIEANYSCPNKLADGGEVVEPVFGYDLEAMFDVDEQIVIEVGEDITLIRKLPPPAAGKNHLLNPTLGYFNRQKGRVALGLFNTIGGQSVLDEYGKPALSVGEKQANLGGLSGRAFAPMAVSGLCKAKGELRESVGVISSIGVDNAQQIFNRVDVHGADSTEGVTVLWENENLGRHFGQTITKMAHEYAELKEAA